MMAKASLRSVPPHRPTAAAPPLAPTAIGVSGGSAARNSEKEGGGRAAHLDK